MDVEQIKKRQMIKVFITEAIMVFSIIGLVVFLMMIASGYWINQDFTVERQGLLQYASIPSGADVIIDGDPGWMQKTNNSKMLSAGEHTVTITKDGYDSWTKKVNIEEGLLYRIAYPRLFLKERSIEKIRELGGIKYSTISPDCISALVLDNNSVFKLATLNSDDFKIKILDMNTESFKNYKINNILSFDWSGDSEKVLMNVQATVLNSEVNEWILINVKNPEKSMRISSAFNINIASAKFVDNSADNILILEQNNMRKINISSQSVSAVLAENVMSMNVFGDNILFVAKNDNEKYVGVLEKNADESKKIIDVHGDNVFVQESEFYGNKYMSIVDGDSVLLYEEVKSDYMSVEDGFEKKIEEKLSFMPTDFKIEKDGDFLFMKDGRKIAVLDMESEKVNEYEIENEKYGWIDGHMIYTIDDAGTLIVYDYDGFNRREIAKNVTREWGAIISERWLYYVSDGWLIRENLLPE